MRHPTTDPPTTQGPTSANLTAAELNALWNRGLFVYGCGNEPQTGDEIRLLNGGAHYRVARIGRVDKDDPYVYVDTVVSRRSSKILRINLIKYGLIARSKRRTSKSKAPE